MQQDRNTLQFVVALGLAVVSVILFLGWSVRPAMQELSYGYASYYTAARLVRDGAGTERFYENRWFLEQSIEQGFVDTPDIFHINPPPMALLLLPLSDFDARDAKVIWTFANIAMLAVALGIIFDTMRRAGLGLAWRSPLPWALIALVAVFNPIWENTYFGQVYVLLLLFLSLGMRAYVLGRDGRLGFWLALMLATKSAGVLLWGLVLLGRNVRALAWGAGTVVAIAVAGAPLLGMMIWWEYVQRLPGLFNQPWTGVTAYQTVASFVHHNLRVEPRSNPEPIADLSGIAAPLATGLNLTLLALAVVAGWLLARSLDGRRLRLARFGLLSSLMVPLQPLGEEHHYTLAIPAALIALILALQSTAGTRRELMLLLTVLGVLLIAVPLQHTDPRLSPGIRALFAYPKLYGGLLIAASLAVYLVIEPRYWRSRAGRAAGDLRAVTRRLSLSQRSASGRQLQDRSPRP